MAPKKGAKKTKEQLAEEKRLAEEAAIAAQEGTCWLCWAKLHCNKAVAISGAADSLLRA